ncbi:MAG: metallophosphoesterase family protein [Chitinophagales bacterium]
MKILFFTDTHFRGNSPVNRRDNFALTLKTKMNEVVQIANDHDVDIVIHGGDFFDSPVPALSIAAEFLEIMRGFNAPIYGVYGNHDIFAGNSITLPRTVLGFAARLGILNLIDPAQPLTIDKNGIRAVFSGSPYKIDIDREDGRPGYLTKKYNQADIHLHVVHGMLSGQNDFPGDRTLIDEIIETEADITLTGHNHLGFGVVQKKGKYFVNPGALVRLSNHRREIERQVGVVLIDLSGGSIKIQIHKLQAAVPGSEILDRSRVDEIKNRSETMERFTREVREAADLKRWNVVDLVDGLARAENINEKVRAEAIKRITSVMEINQDREGWE